MWKTAAAKRNMSIALSGILILGCLMLCRSTAGADAVSDDSRDFNATLFNYGIWTNGTINIKKGYTQGAFTAHRDQCRTGLVPLTEILLRCSDKNIIVTVLYYEKENTASYLGCIKYKEIKTPVSTMAGLERYPTAKYIRFLVQRADKRPVENIESLLQNIEISIDEKYLFIHEQPQSEGAANMRRRAYDLVNLTYVLSADLPAQETKTFPDNIIAAGTRCAGMKYSSTREEQLFVPQAVSLETFASAVLNPNSYLYTRQSSSPNSLTYYGAVCSSFVAYCYGIEDVIPTTISFASYEGFERLPDNMQSAEYAKVGYMLNKGGSHIALITDVIRDSEGNIIAIELSEASHPYMVRRCFTPQEIHAGRLEKGYEMYAYRYIDNVPAADNSSFLTIDSALYKDGTLNPALAPRRGDKANWRFSEKIEIDVLNSMLYDRYVVCNRDTGEVLSAVALQDSVISLEGLEAGRYSLYLSGDEESPPIAFNVVDTEESYTVSGEKVKVSFHSSIAMPTAVLFLNNNRRCSDYRAVRAFHVLTPEEIQSGSCVLPKPSITELEFHDEEYEAPNGTWKMRVMYKTEYGIYSGDISDVNF